MLSLQEALEAERRTTAVWTDGQRRGRQRHRVRHSVVNGPVVLLNVHE